MEADVVTEAATQATPSQRIDTTRDRAAQPGGCIRATTASDHASGPKGPGSATPDKSAPDECGHVVEAMLPAYGWAPVRRGLQDPAKPTGAQVAIAWNCDAPPGTVPP